jgi:hypothetical protein
MPPNQPPLWRRFYRDDPYSDFPLSLHPADTQGWGSRHSLFEYLIDRHRPTLVVEVGTWKGTSALNMAAIADRLGLDTQIVCVDTWLGAPEHFLRDDYFASLRMRHGYPQLFHTFMANVLRSGHQDRISPLPQTSENAAAILQRLHIHPDIVYVDAAHEYGPVLRDLEAYLALLAPGGVLFGDDYPKAPGVVRASHEVAEEHSLRIFAGGGKFLLQARQDPGLADIGMQMTYEPRSLQA